MKNIYLAIIALLLNTHIYAQNAPALNGKILYHSYSSYDNWDGELFILDLSDNSVTNISSGWSVSHAINGMFSPDGTKIVFMADEDGWLQDWDIFLWTIGDEEPVNLTGPFSTDREEDPKFSPDGKTIVFKKNGDIVTMDLEGNIIATLTNTPGVEESMPYYTSDGSKVLYAPGAGAGSDVYIMDADGANSQALVAQSNYQEYYPITRDNESFFYTGWVSSSNLNDQIYLKYYSSDSSIYLPFNQSNANFSDATPVGLDYAVISSSKSGGYGGYDLYIADINTGDIWSLNNYNNSVNSSWEDLGAHYLPDQILFTVLNGAGNPQEGVEIVLYDSGWGSAGTHTTASNGTAAITGLADGNYHYEIYYTGSDGLRHFWGWGTNIPVSGATDFQVSQNYPFFSGDNLDLITLTEGEESTINFNVTNNAPGEDIWTAIEVWVSKDQVETDFHYTMSTTEKINSGTERLYTIPFTPSEAGEYFWKAVVHYNNPTGTPTSDSFNWTSAFTAADAPLIFSSDQTVTSNINGNVEITNTGSLTLSSNAGINGDVTITNGGSLIAVDGTITGTITYTRNIPTTNWYLISSPVVDQDKDAFVAASNVATGTQASNLGFANYDNTTGAWSYYQSGTTSSGNFTQGQGHAVKLDTAGDVVFTGTFNAEDTSIPLTIGTNNGYNLIGNPYLASVSVSELLGQANIGELLSQSTVWLWDQGSESYVVKNFVADIEIAPGQAFFVLANTAGNFGITESMQSHSSDTFQRSDRPEVTISMSNGMNTSSTSIFYMDGATTDFDNGYDSSIFGGVANEFVIYTRAVADGSGRNLGIQCLPEGDYQNMIIPVGVNAKSGTAIVIEASINNFPTGINIYLEDKQDNSFTLLDTNSSYSKTLENDLNGIGRFYIHTTSSSLSTFDLVTSNNLSIYTSSKENLRIEGMQSGVAKVQIYNILGKEIMRTSFEGNGLNDISLPSLNKGVYIVKLATKKGTINNKIIIQ